MQVLLQLVHSRVVLKLFNPSSKLQQPLACSFSVPEESLLSVYMLQQTAVGANEGKTAVVHLQRDGLQSQRHFRLLKVLIDSHSD